MREKPEPPPPIAAAASFRLHLQAELARRCARNTRYSLRAFARALGIDHSTLSQILRGRREPSARAIRELGKRLALDPTLTEFYVVVARHAPPAAVARASEAELLTRDAVVILAEPHHHGLLELCRLEDFSPDSRWIARVLGVPVDQVNIAVSRLTRLGLLRLEKDRWVDCSGETGANASTFPELILGRLFERLKDVDATSKEKSPRVRRARRKE